MPIGSYAVVPDLVEEFIRGQPRSVLDLGMGFGGGGVLVREWLDLGVRPWRTHLVGVECWTEYRNPIWDLYDIIYAQTIEAFLDQHPDSYECVLFSDVLEHFEQGAGREMLRSIRRHVAPGGKLLVTTPAQFFPQDAAYGNEREEHRSYWSEADLTELGFVVKRVGNVDYYCGESWLAIWRN